MNKSKYYAQIDFLKALAIISVIILHTIPSNTVTNPISVFSIYQAVPIFLVLMGTNTLMSFKRHNYQVLINIYPPYLKNRFERVACPLIILGILSLVLGILSNKIIYLGILTFTGYLPVSGPGNYFVSILIQFVLIFPILYKLYNYNSKYLLIISFILTFAFEVLANQILIDNSYLYKACIFRYLFLITLGMWLVDNFEPADLKLFIMKRTVLTGLIASIAYMVGVSALSWSFPYFPSSWQPQTVFSFFYPLILCVIGIKYLPSTSKGHIMNILSLIGKASYHIFLIQIVFFGAGLSLTVVLSNYSLYNDTFYYGVFALIGNITIVLIIGLLFFFIESKIEAFIFSLIKQVKSFKKLLNYKLKVK
ncbi:MULTISPECIES: acyltransferase family protein [Methanobacterium]|uniref:Acyltransferase n=1 Tax=Methanobacterium veterum TaxID=408577 RepID=A0A9E5DJ29_9EURY|nr:MULTISPECIES: acyltransferase [Methanobacterium]MCZ3367496.1 acyltransferase [Methanobacterium veterum]MCZ3373356.1 acyltransferase [Methanobacterium veterum]